MSQELDQCTMDDLPYGYITGLGRDYPHPPLAHLYKGIFEKPGLPMCQNGWNRGDEYSIWRGNIGKKGICKVCMRRALQGLKGVNPSKKHLKRYCKKIGIKL